MRIPLVLLYGATAAFAKQTFNFCRAIGDPTLGDKFQPRIEITKVHEPVHVIVFNLEDLTYTNIPFDFGEGYNLHRNSDGFELCTGDLIESGECYENGRSKGFTLKIKEQKKMKNDILNALVRKGQYISYEVENAGIYCVMGFHESQEHQASTVFKQSYGYLSLKDFGEFQVLQRLMDVFSGLSCLFFVIKIFLMGEYKFSLAEQTLFTMAASLFFTKLFDCLSLYAKNSQLIWKVWGINFPLKEILQLFALQLHCCFLKDVHSWSTGYPMDQAKKDIGMSSGYLCIWIINIIARFRLTFVPGEVPMKFLSNYSYVVMWWLLLQNFNRTISETKSYDAQNKLKKSRNVFILTPIILVSFPMLYLAVTSGNYGFNMLQDYDLKGFIEMGTSGILEQEYEYSFPMALLQNTQVLILPVILLFLAIIWRDNTLEDHSKLKGEEDPADLEFQSVGNGANFNEKK